MTTTRRLRARVGLMIAIVVLLAMIAVSLSVGARPIPLGGVWDALVHYDPASTDDIVVVTQRIPRTVIGVVAGAALALAGVLMQGLTRNPLADPGLLGVNAGASVAVLIAISVLGVTNPNGFVWFAFVGAAVAAVVVALIGGRGPEGASPAKLALTGAAVTAGLTAVTTFVLVTSSLTYDVYRYWQAGGLTSRGLDAVAAVALPLAAGAVIALVCGRGLDLLALGDESATALGHNVTRTRLLGIVAAVLLCGGATAIAGPIVFVGLVVPHLLRPLVGTDHRWLLLVGAPTGSALLVCADVVGRLIAPPGEVQAGLVIAFVGAPVLIWLVLRRGKVLL
jgi:iron complex transport system permease protein